MSGIATESKEVNQLLQHVANGEQDEAETWIKKYPGFLLCKGNVTDLSKREFKDITAFQYAVWALDWHMWKMLLKYMPAASAAEQLAELEARGTAHGKHASWQGLIDAYGRYETYRNEKNYSACEAVWVRGIRGSQLLLPAHVVNEYCHETRAFYPLPDFSEIDVLPRSRKCGGVDWYDQRHGRSGKEWANYRGGMPGSHQKVSRDAFLSPRGPSCLLAQHINTNNLIFIIKLILSIERKIFIKEGLIKKAFPQESRKALTNNII